MVPMRRPEPDTRSIIKPQTAPLRLLLRNLETLLPPDPLHPFVVDPKTLLFYKSRNSPIPIPRILAGQINNLLPQTPLIIPAN
jgi:hypothetical protein